MFELQRNLNVIKTFDIRMKDGPTCMWNQNRIVEFHNSDRDAYNPYSTIWEPVCLKPSVLTLQSVCSVHFHSDQYIRGYRQGYEFT